MPSRHCVQTCPPLYRHSTLRHTLKERHALLLKTSMHEAWRRIFLSKVEMMLLFFLNLQFSKIDYIAHARPTPKDKSNRHDTHSEKCISHNREAQWPIGYGVGLRIKRSSVRIRPWPLRWVLGQGSLLPLSQGEAFTLASISYLAILVKYILAKKKKKKNRRGHVNCFCWSNSRLPFLQQLSLWKKGFHLL